MQKEQLLFYAIKYEGSWHQIKKAIDTNEMWEKMECKSNYVTILDDEYPKKLRRLNKAPWVLFYEGNLNLVEKIGVGIVGSRKCNAYGAFMSKHIVSLIKEKYVIVSGLAKGIDAIAHKTSLTHQTIGVIGCGLNVIYPKENTELYNIMKKNHLVLSEYPENSKPYSYHFPWRNRILAALSNALIVVQAQKQSGTLLSVNEALELGIAVYCVPHMFQDPYGEGCNSLISQGAFVLVNDSDILDI